MDFRPPRDQTHQRNEGRAVGTYEPISRPIDTLATTSVGVAGRQGEECLEETRQQCVGWSVVVEVVGAQTSSRPNHEKLVGPRGKAETMLNPTTDSHTQSTTSTRATRQQGACQWHVGRRRKPIREPSTTESWVREVKPC